MAAVVLIEATDGGGGHVGPSPFLAAALGGAHVLRWLGEARAAAVGVSCVWGQPWNLRQRHSEDVASLAPSHFDASPASVDCSADDASGSSWEVLAAQHSSNALQFLRPAPASRARAMQLPRGGNASPASTDRDHADHPLSLERSGTRSAASGLAANAHSEGFAPASHPAAACCQRLVADAAEGSARAQAWLQQAAVVAAGALSRTVAQVAIHPLDTIKTRMQVSVPTPQLQVWRAVMGCSATRARALAAWACPAGLRDVYRGLGAAVGGTLPASALYFCAEGAARDWLAGALAMDRDAAPCRLLASATAAALSAFVRVPTDVVKHRVQAYAYPCTASAARDIARRGGLYSGFGATLLRDAPEMVIQFSVYAQLKRLLAERSGAQQDGHAKRQQQQQQQQPCQEQPQGQSQGPARPPGAASYLESVVLGGAAGAAAALATTPLDVVKSQLQVGGAPSISAAVASVVRAGGPAALFGGLAPRVLQTTACSALFFTLFEASKAQLAALEASRQAQQQLASQAQAQAQQEPQGPAAVVAAAAAAAAAVQRTSTSTSGRRSKRGARGGAPVAPSAAEAEAPALWDARFELRSA